MTGVSYTYNFLLHETRLLNFLSGLALNLKPPDLCLPSS
jgi:hypothetical protein